MFRDSGKLIIVDIESTCWESETPPEGEVKEIIQIGWCLLDTTTLDRSDKGQIMVRPVRSNISEYCTALTGITPKMSRQGLPFDAACKNMMRRAATRRRAWSSWGVGDRLSFERDCAASGAEMPFCQTHIDIQAILSIFLGYPVRTGQSAALKALGLNEDGVAHRADDDAWNGAGVMAEIIRRSRNTPQGAICPENKTR